MFGKDSERRRGRWMDMISVAQGADDLPTRFGISITRKAGKAVRRNRLKRIIREYLRTHKALWPEKRAIVIRINRPVSDEADLLAELEDMLRSAN